ncbi:hypothetical protein PG990_009217 [Apiospora arundinis]
MAGEPNLAMGLASPEDLELFQRVMRTMQILQSRANSNPPLATRDCQAPRSPHVATLPDAIDSEEYEEEEDSYDELDCEDQISDDDNEDFIMDEYEDESSHGQGAFITEDRGIYVGHDYCNESHKDEAGTTQDNFFDDDEMEGSYDSSDSGDTFIYHDKSPPLYSNPQDTSIPFEAPAELFPIVPPSPAQALAPKQPAVEEEDGDGDGDGDLRCWKHGCNGRKFTTGSNLRRHLREKSHARPACRCPRCGAIFSRTTARNTHVARGSCGRIRRYSNGRIRPHLRVKDTTL